MYSEGCWQLVEQDDLYDKMFIAKSPTPHTYYRERPERELYYWLSKAREVEYNLDWVYNKIVGGGLVGQGDPGVSYSIWVRSYWKHHLRIKKLIDERTNQLVLRMVINRNS